MDFNVKSNQIENCFPLLSYEDGLLVSKSGDITRLFELTLPQVYTSSDVEIDAMNECWCRAVRTLPNYSIVHKQDVFSESVWQDEPFSDSFLQEASARHFMGRTVLRHRCFLYVTLSTKNGLKTTSAGNAILRNRVVPQDAIDSMRIDTFNDSVDQMVNILKSGGIACRELTEDEVLGTDDHFGVIEQYLTLNYSGEGEILYDLHVNEDDLMVGDKYVSCFSLGELTDLPNVVSTSKRNEKLSTDVSSLADCFSYELCLKLPFDHIYNQYIFVDDSNENLRELEKQGRKMESLSAISRENAVNKEFNDEYLTQAQVMKEHSIHAAFNVLVWDSSYTRLLEKNSQVGGVLSNLDCQVSKTEVIVPHIFWAGIPGASSNYPSEMKFLSFIAPSVCFFNMESNYRDITGENGYGLKLTDRISGAPVRVDVSDEPVRRGWASAKNKFILGPSGSGKSFFTNVMMAQKYEQGEHLVIVDVGDSYLGLCQLIHERTNGEDGIYFTFKEEEPISFNPFYVEDYVYTEEKMAQLLSLICILWKNEHEDISKAEETHIETALNAYIGIIKDHREIFPCFNTFYAFLSKQFKEYLVKKSVRIENFDIDNLIQVLAPYAKGGKYEYLLNSKDKLDLLHKRFVVFELDNIKDHKVLFPVVTIVLMDTYISKMRRLQPHERKIILIEEAWKAISKSGTAEFIKYLYKTVRKHNGEVIVVTQEVGDIIGNEIIKDAIINNADEKILLDQSKFLNRFDEIQSTLALSEKEKALVLSINKDLQKNEQRAKYKEVFISFNSAFSAVYGVEVSPEEYLTFSTTKEEKGVVLQYAKELGSMRKGIMKYIDVHYKK
ncbi:MAG: TraG family conjugative transposon ATPase [Paludibacteraceae bacterium]|nr:TraG family conjugative transposon ATPase [Paludibacteraceae bacterium]